MFEITIKDHISSAHQLKGYDGPCAVMHGHTWKIEVTVAGTELNRIGLLTDFKVLKKQLKTITEPLDHVCLNDLPAFKDLNPSTENLARHIYGEFAKICTPLTLKRVQVWESDTASVIYYE